MPVPPLTEFLKSTVLFHGLPPAILQRASQRLVVRQHGAGATLVLEQDWGDSVYLLIQGWVKVQTRSRDGRDIILNILGPGNLFGEMASLESSPRASDVVTLTPVTVGSLPAADFWDLINTEPQVGFRLAQLLVKRIQQLNRRLQVRESDSRARLADVLLFLAEGQGQVQSGGVLIPNLAHRELGGLCGLSRETVTRVLKQFEQEGLLVRSDPEHFYLPDRRGLEAVVEGSR
ncbi:MAG: Crp/Fnr family transcriptional regulator [Gloeomargarita sp. SKYBB_i_bin120]|nr:Crp/Fnr family transcriptional regulator [Gloeomargarita sp. SKYG98]MCS7291624.1 Crp/Fnr family transcriptional regulator [Gloeomargarita sp. SKYB120]MDW8177183.1 Crp/Fnr family transcriptional regulator [Gloeomargarita sp. SKYBB_i_bin120]